MSETNQTPPAIPDCTNRLVRHDWMPIETRMALIDLGDAFQQFSRNGRWGTCGCCPRDVRGNAYPEHCENTDRHDHHMTVKKLAVQWDNRVRLRKPNDEMRDGERKNSHDCEPMKSESTTTAPERSGEMDCSAAVPLGKRGPIELHTGAVMLTVHAQQEPDGSWAAMVPALTQRCQSAPARDEAIRLACEAVSVCLPNASGEGRRSEDAESTDKGQ
jgi:hypothetical protein